MRWQKGQSGNPAGPGVLTPELKKARKLTSKATVEILSKCIFMTRDEISTRLNEPETPGIELAILTVLANCIKHGDATRLNFLLDRLIGKVTDKIEYQLPKPTVMELRGQDAALIIGRMKEEDEDGM